MHSERRTDGVGEAAEPARPGRRSFLTENWLNIVGALGVVFFVGYVPCILLSEMVTDLGSSRAPQASRAPQPFDRQAWLAPDSKGEGQRYWMLGSLLGSHQLIGMTREDVTALLGPMEPFGGEDPSRAAYDLGLSGNPYGLDPAGLVLSFRDGKVCAWEIRTE